MALDPHRLFDYIRVAREHVSFDVPLSEVIQLAMIARDIDPANLNNLTLNGSTGTAGRANVVFLAPGDTFSRVRDDGIY
ncbi:MAG: hypothetical protein ACT4OM_12455 [Actinomycetota bacterium]